MFTLSPHRILPMMLLVSSLVMLSCLQMFYLFYGLDVVTLSLVSPFDDVVMWISISTFVLSAAWSIVQILFTRLVRLQKWVRLAQNKTNPGLFIRSDVSTFLLAEIPPSPRSVLTLPVFIFIFTSTPQTSKILYTIIMNYSLSAIK